MNTINKCTMNLNRKRHHKFAIFFMIVSQSNMGYAFSRFPKSVPIRTKKRVLPYIKSIKNKVLSGLCGSGIISATFEPVNLSIPLTPDSTANSNFNSYKSQGSFSGSMQGSPLVSISLHESFFIVG